MTQLEADRWVELLGALGCPGAEERFVVVRDAYAEKHRHYHTGQHVAECLELFDSLRDLCEHPTEVEYAIWLHDIVYAPRKQDNEERSAEIAVRWLRECDAPEEVVDRIERLILVTRHTGEPATEDERVILDIDLHVLGASEARFDEYEAQVRTEYRWVPGPLFRKGRAKILEDFASRDPLYHTEECRTRFEAGAKRNLERSLEKLRR